MPHRRRPRPEPEEPQPPPIRRGPVETPPQTPVRRGPVQVERPNVTVVPPGGTNRPQPERAGLQAHAGEKPERVAQRYAGDESELFIPRRHRKGGGGGGPRIVY